MRIRHKSTSATTAIIRHTARHSCQVSCVNSRLLFSGVPAASCFARVDHLLAIHKIQQGQIKRYCEYCGYEARDKGRLEVSEGI